ncbi:acyltransferase [Sphingomonas rosea]|uniref:acyltransferase family protein n=1 Tax=Sphingomonas rosea TaxID=335605 RepID=UPI0031DF0866
MLHIPTVSSRMAVTSPAAEGRRILSLQVLRGIAASMVVILHVSHLAQSARVSDWRFHLGAAGVDLFFALSGVIITIIPKRSPGDFLRRRLIRVVPLYFLMTMLAWPFAKGVTAANAFTSLTLWPAWGAMTQPILGVGWTLSFELLFYVAACASIASRRNALVLAGTYLSAMALIPSGLVAAQFLGNPIILEFLAGVAIGALWKRGHRVSPPIAAIVVVAALALWLLNPAVETLTSVVGTMNAQNSLWRAVEIGVPAAMLVFGFLHLDFAWPSSAIAVGDASYSIYLAHAAILTPLSSLVLPPILQPFSLAIYLLLSAIASFAVYNLFEKPILALLRQRGKAGTGIALAPA